MKTRIENSNITITMTIIQENPMIVSISHTLQKQKPHRSNVHSDSSNDHKHNNNWKRSSVSHDTRALSRIGIDKEGISHSNSNKNKIQI